MSSRPEDSTAAEGDQHRIPDLNEEVAAAFGAVTHIEVPPPVELTEEEAAAEQELPKDEDESQGS